MHELSLCQSLIDRLTALVRQHGAVAVSRVELQVGQLSGVEPELLRTAFLLAQEGTVAATAELHLVATVPRVRCADCGRESEVPPNRLCCPACGSVGTDLIGGHELILARVEMLQEEQEEVVTPDE